MMSKVELRLNVLIESYKNKMDEIIAAILQDEDDGTFCAFYALENVYESDFDSLDAETIEEAKAEVEERIVNLTQEQIECLQSWVDMFTSIKAVNYE